MGAGARFRLGACLLLVGIAAASAAASDPSGGPYVLKAARVAAGGGAVAGGTYTLNGSVGQHEATPVSVQGGSYDLEGGLRPGPSGPPDAVFASSFE